MRRRLGALVRGVDRRVAPLALRLAGESDGLLALLFHTLLARPDEDRDELLYPQQRTTVDDLRQAVEHLLGAGYRFVGAHELGRPGAVGGRRALLTFDDGYHNNLRALPVLRELGVPAVFYVASGHVAENRPYWWDVVWRERRRQGLGTDAIEGEIGQLKLRPPAAVTDHLRREFGARADRPAADLDRPLTPVEVAELSSEPLVELGNHSADHAILTRCGGEEAGEQIRRCQDDLESWTGRRPTSIAYPNGDVSPTVLAAARRAGLTSGVTLVPGKTGPAAELARPLRLRRFTLWGGSPVAAQCRAFRSDLSLYTLLRGA